MGTRRGGLDFGGEICGMEEEEVDGRGREGMPPHGLKLDEPRGWRVNFAVSQGT